MRSQMLRTALLAAGAVLLVAAPASAQDRHARAQANYVQSDSGYYDADYRQPSEGVTITQPRYRYRQSKLGAPNMRVFLSREIRYDDLDLTSRSGAEILRDRVRLTARLLCRDIDQRWPVTAGNGGDSITCYHDAAENALYRADRAIRDARRSYYD